MVSVDANLLLYAYHRASPYYEQSRTWLEETFASGQDLGIPVQVMLAVIQICASPALARPHSIQEVLGIVDSWMLRPQVSLLAPGPEHWRIFRQLYPQSGATTGKLSTDVPLAALAIEHSTEFFSADTDFARFPGLRWSNPLSLAI